MKIAFLVYDSYMESRRAQKSFDGQSNIGAYVIIDSLKQSGIDVSFCSIDSAFKYDIVLVSMTSVLDILAYLQLVVKHKDWQINTRKFKILIGGFGVQNINALIGFADYAYFGRAENEIADIINSNLNYESNSLMDLDNVKPVIMNQTLKLYPNELKLNVNGCPNYRESFIGCPNKCFYCHYTFSRKWIKSNDGFVSEGIYNKGSIEIDIRGHKKYEGQPRITMAIDGLSEYQRYYFNRRVSNEQIFDMLQYFVDTAELKGLTAFHIHMYNIAGVLNRNYDNDLEYLKEILLRLKFKSIKLYLQLFTFKFIPAVLTPAAYEKVTLDNSIARSPGQTFLSNANLQVWKTQFTSSDFLILKNILVIRFTEKYRPLLNEILFNKKLNGMRSAFAFKYIREKYDINDLYREYDINEQLPAWYLESYIPNEKIKLMRLKMLNYLKAV